MIWTLWLLGIAGSFALLEAWAFHKRRPTLSRFMAELGRKWPPILVVFGMLFGGLAVHFFWHWCPTGLSAQGG